MFYGLPRSCLVPMLAETGGPVSVSSQVNCKWALTSGLQYAVRIHVSTNWRLARLTVTTEQLPTQSHVIAPQKRKDGLHMAPNHSLQQGEEWDRKEKLYDSAKTQASERGGTPANSAQVMLKLFVIYGTAKEIKTFWVFIHLKHSVFVL